jgi:hypothetical protein
MYEPMRPVLERGIRRRSLVQLICKKGWELANHSSSVPHFICIKTPTKDKKVFSCYVSKSRNVLMVESIKVIDGAVSGRKFLVVYADLVVQHLIEEAKRRGAKAILIGTSLRDFWYSFIRLGFDVSKVVDNNVRARLIFGEKGEISKSYD